MFIMLNDSTPSTSISTAITATDNGRRNANLTNAIMMNYLESTSLRRPSETIRLVDYNN
jgi:hypothetical protein